MSYYYGPLRERSRIKQILEVLLFFFDMLIELQGNILKDALGSEIYALRPFRRYTREQMQHYMFIPHQRIYARFNRRFGKSLLVITRD